MRALAIVIYTVTSPLLRCLMFARMIYLSRYVMNRLELQISSTTSRRRRPAGPSGIMLCFPLASGAL